MVERFMLAASDQAGKKVVDLGFTFLTGGLADLPELLKNTKNLLAGSVS